MEGQEVGLGCFVMRRRSMRRSLSLLKGGAEAVQPVVDEARDLSSIKRDGQFEYIDANSLRCCISWDLVVVHVVVDRSIRYIVVPLCEEEVTCPPDPDVAVCARNCFGPIHSLS